MAERPRRNFRGRGRRRKVCSFCVHNKNHDAKDRHVSIDYKNSDLLRKYVSDRGKILPRRVTGTCAKHQRELTTAIKRSRHVALLPFTRD
ncbi:30S ribosomal protein S18 [Mycoplasmatota bacterium]|nr:30S ribosomal protein S18 [Mycoplasmatota bacterium]